MIDPAESRRFGALGASRRFEIVRCLGEGGMGVVYEAIDKDVNATVAIKVLHALSPDHITRIKREFRALSDLRHPNLVNLGELIEGDGQLFFTMELVRGVDLISYVKGRNAPADDFDHDSSSRAVVTSALAETIRIRVDQPKDLSLLTPPTSAPVSSGIQSTLAASLGQMSDGRLRSAISQLTSGLMALHQSGKVHRDVKPSNVLVTAEGRVVVLDLGLVTEVKESLSSLTGQSIVGTAAYMAPEQAASKPVGPEADWYSLGVVLYEALCGRLPFDGPTLQVLIDKQRLEPVRPSTFLDFVPPDLERLCMDLLNFEPTRRPDGPTILKRLGLSTPRMSTPPSSGPVFVGRTSLLSQLQEAFEESLAGRATAVRVDGESGVGKSALVRRFAAQMTLSSPNAVVLSGRCYEREAVAFKAIDGIIDALAAYMQKVGPAESATLVPRRAALLPVVFPGLRRVPALANAPHVDIADPAEFRQRVFTALRDLFSLLCERHPVILAIDDFQWSDADSHALLADLLRPPDAPPLLLILTSRLTLEQNDAAYRAIPKLPCSLREVHVTRLSRTESRELAMKLARHAGVDRLRHVDWDSLVKEADGHPLFIDELVRHVALNNGEVLLHLTGRPSLAPIHLDEALWTRIAALDNPVRELLEVIAIAGAPTSQEVIARSAEMEFAQFGRHVSYLRVANLICTSGPKRTDLIEPFHDRIREAVLRNLDASTKRKWHGRLARALQSAEVEDAQVLTLHYHGAGNLELAARFAAIAAKQAFAKLAFDRAAHLYKLALDLGNPVQQRRRLLLGSLGDALANAGQGQQAANCYLEATPGAGRADALDLRRRAAEQLLRSGRIDEGIVETQAVLSDIGEFLPKTMFWVLILLLVRRIQIRLRGLSFKSQEANQIPESELRRIDVCYSVAALLGVVDTARGAFFQTQNVLLALRAGEPVRVARAISLEVGYSSVGGGKSAKRTAELAKLSNQLAQRSCDFGAMATSNMADALSAYLEGRWRYSREKAEHAETMLREHCTGVFWEISTTIFISTGALAYLGEIRALNNRVRGLHREAIERSDLYAALNVCSGFQNLAWLAHDEPFRARRITTEAIEQWSSAGVHIQHFSDLFAQVNIDLYEGKAIQAIERVQNNWQRMGRALILQIQQNRIEMHDMLARAAIASAAQDRDTQPNLQIALRSARRIEREQMAWANPLATRIRAAVAALNGQANLAVPLLGEASDGFERCGMRLFMEAARACRGSLIGGVVGRRDVESAELWMTSEGVRTPSRLIATLMPGFPERD